MMIFDSIMYQQKMEAYLFLFGVFEFSVQHPLTIWASNFIIIIVSKFSISWSDND